eukprot:184324-Chlamydomonas_euryale.AAC.4
MALSRVSTCETWLYPLGASAAVCRELLVLCINSVQEFEAKFTSTREHGLGPFQTPTTTVEAEHTVWHLGGIALKSCSMAAMADPAGVFGCFGEHEATEANFRCRSVPCYTLTRLNVKLLEQIGCVALPALTLGQETGQSTYCRFPTFRAPATGTNFYSSPFIRTGA